MSAAHANLRLWTVRPARTSDLRPARVLLTACGLPIDGIDDQFGENYAVAEAGADMHGIAGVEVHGAHGLLRSVAVEPSQQGKGIAASLLANRIEWSRQRGLDSIYLLTATAERYFARHGFVAVARDSAPAAIRQSREFVETCPATAVVMRKAL